MLRPQLSLQKWMVNTVCFPVVNGMIILVKPMKITRKVFSKFNVKILPVPISSLLCLVIRKKPATLEGKTAHAQLYSWTDWANWAFQPRRVPDFQYNNEAGVPYVDPRAPLTFYGGTIGDQEYCDNCPGGPKPFDFATLGYWYRKVTNKENKPNEDNIQTGNNIRLMRYADVLLMRAESLILQGQVSEGIDFINQVRTRIGAFPYNDAYTQEQAFELLKRERQLELMGEMHRYNDIKRWGILKETMNIELQAMFGTPNVQDKHYLFPIPQKELDTNKEFGTVEDSWN